ncbi:MAG: prolyl aminopeptidase [Halothiobacillaceae bacterium]|nr:MAG: prolyl aminopeptidase [Halothiobacillaceae bacterium]
MNGKLIFGLSTTILSDLQRVFSAYPEIDKVVIFGSRAKGTFKNGSDIDLAVFAPTLSDQRFTQLWDELDALPLVFKMDLLHWDRLSNQRLKEKISVEGALLYSSSTAKIV